MRNFLISLIISLQVFQPLFANQYEEQFNRLDKDTRTKHAPSLIGLKLAESLNFSNQYLGIISNRFQGSIDDINANLLNLNLFEHQMLGLSASPSIAQYKEYIKIALQHREITDLIYRQIEESKQIGKVFETYENFFQNYCAPRMSLLPYPDQLGSVPFSVKPDGSVYTRLEVFGKKQNENAIVSDDPIADGAAIVTFVAAIAVGIALYAASAGMAFTAAATALFSVSSGGSGALLLVGTGPGALIIVAAVVVAAVVAYGITENENRKRKKEAEERYQREIDDFNSAKDNYMAHRMTADEFREMGMDVCESREWQKRINKSDEAHRSNLKSVQNSFTELDATRNALIENQKRVNNNVALYETKLIELYSLEYVKSLRESIIPTVKLNSAIQYANQAIKAKAESLTAYYATHRTDCLILQDEGYRIRGELESKRDFILRSYQTPENAQDPFFQEQLPLMVNKTLNTYDSRVTRCFERNNSNPGIGPIYDL